MSDEDFSNVTDIGEVRTGVGRSIHVRSLEVHGHRRIDIRLFYENDAGKYLPSRKGFVLPLDRLDNLMSVLASVPDDKHTNFAGKTTTNSRLSR